MGGGHLEYIIVACLMMSYTVIFVCSIILFRLLVTFQVTC